MSEPDCVFCDIVAGDAPASLVAEDTTTIAFMDINPATSGHVLVVPKSHAAQLADLDESTGARVMQMAMRCAAALRRSEIRCDGINLFLADGAVAGQDVFHTHMHVLPRSSGDGFGLRIDYDRPPRRSVLDDQAALISAHVSS